MKIANFETHPAADLFPLMEGQELQALANDIKANGLHNPIVILFNGGDSQILDGRNRARACLLAFDSIPTRTSDGRPSLIDWKDDCHGTGSPTAWVISQNLRRRHLDESQRAMVGARAKSLFEAEAKIQERDRGGKFAPAAEPAGKSRDHAAAMVNVSPRSVQDAAKVIGSGTPHLIAAVEQGRIPVSVAVKMVAEPRDIQDSLVAKVEADGAQPRQLVNELRRQGRVEKLEELSAQPLSGKLGRFPILYADPPWRYQHVETESRAIENQYPTLALDEICALPIAELTTPDCVLFLWATSPKLAEAIAVVDSWGFEYRTCIVWDKERLGMGYWARQQHELLLIATRGAPPTPAPDARPASVVRVRRDNEHSRKPVEFYELIERMFPTLPKLELFARVERPGWKSWGNEVLAA